jgi:hypothetical protein
MTVRAPDALAIDPDLSPGMRCAESELPLREPVLHDAE